MGNLFRTLKEFKWEAAAQLVQTRTKHTFQL